MAFVIRSPKNLEEKIAKSGDPTIYPNFNFLSEIKNKYISKNNTNKSHISFGSKTLRNSLYIKGSTSPGPGYYKIENELVKESFNPNFTGPNDPEGPEGEHAQLFISKEKRFKEFNKNTKDNPSPCDYFLPKNSFEPTNLRKNLTQLKTFGIYSPFSSRRQISIPTNDLYYKINDKGEVEVKQEVENIKECKNNLGPGSYDIKFYEKKNNVIDWSKGIKKEKDNKTDDKKDYNIKLNLDSYNTFADSNAFESTMNEKTNNSTNLLTHNFDKYADKICCTETFNSQEKLKKKALSNLKLDIPGPGQYHIPYNIDAPISFSNVNNFGSNVSRGLLFPLKKNKIKIGLKTKTEPLIIKTENNSPNKEINNKVKKSNKINKDNDLFILHSLHAKDIKDKYLKDKNLYLTKLGPGAYNPLLQSEINKKETTIQNFNSLEKRFTSHNNEFNTPGVGTYSIIDSYSSKKSSFKPIVPPNISKRNIDGISSPKIQETKEKVYYENHRKPGVGDYYPEIFNSIEFKIYKNAQNNNDKKPCFNCGEQRFFEFKKKYEDDNHIGKYNLAKNEKEKYQRISPFLSQAEKDESKLNNVINKTNSNLGPGTYRYDSYFDWNKKSYNMLFA